jgi:hypothetical protein
MGEIQNATAADKPTLKSLVARSISATTRTLNQAN